NADLKIAVTALNNCRGAQIFITTKELVIGIGGKLRFAVHQHLTIAEDDNAIAEHLDGVEIVGNKNNRAAVGAKIANTAHTFLLKMTVAHRQRLVHQKNIGISVNGNGKRQAHHHPGRIGTQRLADKATEFSEFNDVIPATTEFFLRHSQQQPVGADIGKSAHGKVEAGTQLQQTGDPTTGFDSAAIRKYNTVKNFEQGGFAGA